MAAVRTVKVNGISVEFVANRRTNGANIVYERGATAVRITKGGSFRGRLNMPSEDAETLYTTMLCMAAAAQDANTW